jgi:hypothetical protein
MSMSHKAYAFDWRWFECDLRPLLEDALVTDNARRLETFIDDHREVLTDPYEGEPLADDWRETLENRDVHEYGDYALTRFYDPANDCGIGGAWARLSERLSQPAADALLGCTIGPPMRLFDPGRQGSYFQASAQVPQSLAMLKPLALPDLAVFIALLEQCAAERCGVYVTF